MSNTTLSVSPRARFIAPLAVLLCALAGCQSAAPVTGKVIRGDVSFIGVVDAGDERLKAAGLPGAVVAATTDPRTAGGGAVLAKITSGPQGDFALAIKDQSTLTGATGFTARLDGYAPASGAMPMPPEDRRLLVILKPVATTPSAPAAPEPTPRER